MQIIAFLLSKKGKVAANEYERRGLCFTPRGTMIKTNVQTQVIEKEVRVSAMQRGSALSWFCVLMFNMFSFNFFFRTLIEFR